MWGGREAGAEEQVSCSDGSGLRSRDERAVAQRRRREGFVSVFKMVAMQAYSERGEGTGWGRINGVRWGVLRGLRPV